MAEFWNYRYISKPVNCKMKISSIDHAEILCKARKTLEECAQYFVKKDGLHTESAILGQLIYKKNGQLRRDKSFQGLKQVESAIRRLRDVDLQAIASNMHEDFEQAELETAILSYLPSRQMWEYMLTRILGVASLTACITTRCLTVFLHVKRQLSVGHLIPLNLTFLVMVSKIWACCQSLSEACQKWYQVLYPVLSILAPTNVRWLPEEHELPYDLTVWLKSHAFSPALQETSLEEASDEWSLLLEKYHQVHEDHIKRKTESNISDTKMVSYLDCAHAEDLGEPVHLNEANPVLDEKSVKRPQEVDQKALTDANRKKQVYSQGSSSLMTDLTRRIENATNFRHLTRRIQNASTFRQLTRVLKNYSDTTSYRARIKHDPFGVGRKKDQCYSALCSLNKKALSVKKKSNPAQYDVCLKRAKEKLLSFCHWVQMESIVAQHTLDKNAQKQGSKRNKKKSTCVDASLNETKHGDNEMEYFQSNLSKTCTALTKKELSRVIKSVRNKHRFKLQGTVYQLSQEEASTLMSDLVIFKNRMDQSSSNRAHRNSLRKATQALKRVRKKLRVAKKQLKKEQST